MYLNQHLFSKNYGMAGALSVILFIIAAILCLFVYFSLNSDGTRSRRRRRDRFRFDDSANEPKRHRDEHR